MTQKKASAAPLRRQKQDSAKALTKTGNRSTAKEAQSSQESVDFELGLSTSRPELLDAGGKSDNELRQFLYDFSVLASQLETARAYLAASIGITAPQYNILMVVSRKQGRDGISVSDVARFLHVSGAFVTTEVGKLENIGLILKKPNPNDARGTLLSLSLEGQARVREVEPERLFVNDHLFQSLSRKDFQHVARSLSAMLDDFSTTIQMLQMRQARTKRTQGARNKKVG